MKSWKIMDSPAKYSKRPRSRLLFKSVYFFTKTLLSLYIEKQRNNIKIITHLICSRSWLDFSNGFPFCFLYESAPCDDPTEKKNMI